MIAALFIDPRGPYVGRDDVDPWDAERDARLYEGPHAVVAHPPCHLWVNLAAVNWKRYGRQRPAWYPGGEDGGCFASAVKSVRVWCGVLEHPAFSHAWVSFGLTRPSQSGWQYAGAGPGARQHWVCEVWQSAYGHKARKRTWLYYVGLGAPDDLNWTREPGTHQCGKFDRIKPTLAGRAASATPPAFAKVLIDLARGAR